MQVPPPPPNSAAGVAGTARAQSRGTDQDSTSKQVTDRKRTLNPSAKSSEADELSLEAGAETDDRDADGHGAYGGTRQGTNEQDEPTPPDIDEHPQRASIDTTGHIDFQA